MCEAGQNKWTQVRYFVILRYRYKTHVVVARRYRQNNSTQIQTGLHLSYVTQKDPDRLL
jgi:hypothetical protein